MRRGYLSEYFEGVAIKTLSAVEADLTRSHQHEYGAIRPMADFMGTPNGRERLDTRFMYLDDELDEPVIEDAYLTYYDARAAQPHRSPELRFYFPTTRVSQMTEEGDLLILAKRRDGGLLVIIAAKGSTASSQLEWLFGFSQDFFPRFSVRSELENEQDRIGFVSSSILESIGIEVERAEETYLDTMLEQFGAKFPTTRVFSEFARSTLKGLDPNEDPDAVLMAWMEREEILFRTLEKHIVGEWLQNSFTGEVEDFMKASLSIQNRRKSRAGSALEGHLETIFTALQIQFSTQGRTENNSKPDFLFPTHTAYHDPLFPREKLTMLGVKTTCKDRWRQVLSEAERIPTKHLLTLESAISTNQTNEMRANQLQLVIPSALHSTYGDEQRNWLWSLRDFTTSVLRAQRRSEEPVWRV